MNTLAQNKMKKFTFRKKKIKNNLQGQNFLLILLKL